jgi:hypothetical protein
MYDPRPPPIKPLLFVFYYAQRLGSPDAIKSGTCRMSEISSVSNRSRNAHLFELMPNTAWKKRSNGAFCPGPGSQGDKYISKEISSMMRLRGGILNKGLVIPGYQHHGPEQKNDGSARRM